MEETRQLQCYALVDNHDLVITEMPEKIQNKFKMLDELLDNLEEADNDNEAKGIVAQIEACDTGLTSDIRSYMAEKGNSYNNDDEDNDSSSQDDKMANGGQTDNVPTHEKPSWRFWM